jgi:hypothetical protein
VFTTVTAGGDGNGVKASAWRDSGQINNKADKLITYRVLSKQSNRATYLLSFHPETPDEKLLVSDLESGDFLSWQGNRGIARRRTTVRRTSKTED